jgi:demethylmenaquinone methyltransferase/2-methoxy-6-polyprenyl-1,4-benzoquinol methylase
MDENLKTSAAHEQAAGLGGLRPAATGAGLSAEHMEGRSLEGNPQQAVGHQDCHSQPQGADRKSAAHDNPPQAVGHPVGPSRRDVHRMFDRIAPRYDLLNHLLSFNRDKAWRRRMAALLPTRTNLKLLDLATGTGDQLLALYSSGKIASGVGIDPAEKMLAIGQEKIARRGLSDKLSLSVGSAEQIPFPDKSFDVVTISFGIRNVTDVAKSLSEMHRVLKPEGRALILEFSLPTSKLIKAGYLFYFRYILPALGGIISGDREAYRYLNQTVESFPHGENFAKLMREAGFEGVKATPLTFGVASIYQGDKR